MVEQAAGSGLQIAHESSVLCATGGTDAPVRCGHGKTINICNRSQHPAHTHVSNKSDLKHKPCSNCAILVPPEGSVREMGQHIEVRARIPHSVDV